MRPFAPRPVHVFEGADEAHAVDGLRLHGLVVNGQRIGDADAARRVAGLTIGPFVKNVSFS